MLEGVEGEGKIVDKLLGMGRSVDTTSSAVTVTTVKEKEEAYKLLGMGSRLDTTSPAVTVYATGEEQDDPQHHNAGGETGDLQHHQPTAQEQQDQQEGKRDPEHHQPADQESQDHPGGQCGGESCNNSMHIKMPRSILWASQGGIAPKETCI